MGGGNGQGVERRAHEYFLRCTHGKLYYFSALMHLWDVQVVELFSRICKPYVPLILSCNEPLGQQPSAVWLVGSAARQREHHEAPKVRITPFRGWVAFGPM